MLISIIGGCQFSTDINKICGYIFIDCVALAKQGDNILGSVRPSVCALMAEPFEESLSVEGVCLCVE